METIYQRVVNRLDQLQQENPEEYKNIHMSSMIRSFLENGQPVYRPIVFCRPELAQIIRGYIIEELDRQDSEI